MAKLCGVEQTAPPVFRSVAITLGTGPYSSHGRSVIGQAIIFLPCGLFYLSINVFSSPNLSGRRIDVCHTSTHGVALVRIYNAGMKCAARGSLEMQDPKNRQK